MKAAYDLQLRDNAPPARARRAKALAQAVGAVLEADEQMAADCSYITVGFVSLKGLSYSVRVRPDWTR